MMMIQPNVSELVLQRLAGSPLARQLEEEERAERQAERQDLARERQQLIESMATAAPGLQLAIADALATLEAARLAARQAADRYQQARAAATTSATTTRREIARLEVRLRETAPREIDAFVAELDQLLQDENTRGSNYRTMLEARTTFDGRQVIPHTWAVSPSQRHEAILSAQRQARDLVLEPFDDDELAQRIHAFRASIPEVSIA